MHGQLGVLDQTRLDVVSARNDSEQAGIGWCLVIGVLDQHSHFARPGEQLGQAASRERDVDAIGSDFHPAEQGHEHRFDCVWCAGSEFFRNLTATFDERARRTVLRFTLYLWARQRLEIAHQRA
jgi:hypothetical protein